jgi:hypothetical protein
MARIKTVQTLGTGGRAISRSELAATVTSQAEVNVNALDSCIPQSPSIIPEVGGWVFDTWMNAKGKSIVLD